MKIAYCYVLDKEDGGYVHAKEFISAFKLNGNQVFEVEQEVHSVSRFYKAIPILSKIASKFLAFCAISRFLFKVSCRVFITRPDAVIFRHAPNMATVPAQIFIGLFFPIVLEVNAVNEIEYQASPKKVRVACDRAAIAKAKAIFVVSNPVKKFLVESGYCIGSKVTVIENGVDENKFKYSKEEEVHVRRKLGISPTTSVFGFVGSMKKWHGVDNIIQIAKYGESLLGDHVFLLVGNGELKCEYEKKVEEFGLRDTVRFVGRVEHNDIPSYLSTMDVLLSPHSADSVGAKMDFHGSPLKIFEYMAMSKPIIASPQGQIKSIIEDGVNGRLIEAENTQEILQELIKLQRQPEYRNSMGAAARASVVRNYTWKINALKVEDVCLRVV